eukprot:SAG31_NODE_106_length_24954_cov_17.726413_9_plen_204_part_00
MGSPEVDAVTVKLRELQCRCYANLGKPHETMQCANRVLGHDSASIEGRKWRCEAHMQFKQWDAAVNECQQAAQSREQEAAQLFDKAKRMKHKSEQKDYYGTLGVEEKADEKAIKKAYRKLAMQYHPDRVSGEEEKKEAEVRFPLAKQMFAKFSLVCAIKCSVWRHCQSFFTVCAVPLPSFFVSCVLTLLRAPAGEVSRDCGSI